MNAMIVLGLSYLAMAAVALSMGRHQGQVFGREMAASKAWLLRIGGWALLAVALAPALGAWGTSVGIVAWLGLLTFAAIGAGVQLTYAARSLLWSGPAVGAGAALLWVASA